MNYLSQLMFSGSFLSERLRAGDAATLSRFNRHPGTLDDTWSMFEDLFSTWWHDSGFPRVVIGHRHAAALMASNTPVESVSDARTPWSAFVIDVPSGLLFAPSGKAVLHVCVTARADGVSAFPIDHQGPVAELFSAKSLAAFGMFCTKPLTEMLARLVLGVSLEMTCTTFKDGGIGPRPSTKDPRTGEPRAWVFRLTRDVKVDCRDAVRDYAREVGGGSPTVQTLVRGHWRRQPCGKGGADRKHIFVEPYWRGPEDAHIALRKHRTPATQGEPRG